MQKGVFQRFIECYFKPFLGASLQSSVLQWSAYEKECFGKIFHSLAQMCKIQIFQLSTVFLYLYPHLAMLFSCLRTWYDSVVFTLKKLSCFYEVGGARSLSRNQGGSSVKEFGKLCYERF